MACIIETTHGLLIAHLLEQGWPFYPVNPRTVDRHRARTFAKTDAIDAYLLAKTGRANFQDLRQLNPDSEVIQELKTLTRDQDALIQMQTRLVKGLTACLKAYYPVALDLFCRTPARSLDMSVSRTAWSCHCRACLTATLGCTVAERRCGPTCPN